MGGTRAEQGREDVDLPLLRPYAEKAVESSASMKRDDRKSRPVTATGDASRSGVRPPLVEEMIDVLLTHNSLDIEYFTSKSNCGVWCRPARES